MTAPFINGTPSKRYRRTRAELDALDAQLYELVREHAPCTVRQIYYRAVVAYLCEKTDAGYNLIQRRLLILRRAGVVPYHWIEDNARTYYGGGRYTDLEEFGTYASRHLFALDYWRHEHVNVELWCESDSIAGTIRETITKTWGLRLYVARGFSSETYAENSAQGLKADGRPAYIYLLSDFDPSGISLAEDIGRKLMAFTNPLPVTVRRIALNAEQVEAWALPTHALKKSDSRAARFRREHSNVACELEAIPPRQLRTLVSDAIAQHIDPRRLEAAKQDEVLQREALMQLPEFFKNWRGLGADDGEGWQ